MPSTEIPAHVLKRACEIDFQNRPRDGTGWRRVNEDQIRRLLAALADQGYTISEPMTPELDPERAAERAAVILHKATDTWEPEQAAKLVNIADGWTRLHTALANAPKTIQPAPTVDMTYAPKPAVKEDADLAKIGDQFARQWAHAHGAWWPDPVTVNIEGLDVKEDVDPKKIAEDVARAIGHTPEPEISVNSERARLIARAMGHVPQPEPTVFMEGAPAEELGESVHEEHLDGIPYLVVPEKAKDLLLEYGWTPPADDDAPGEPAEIASLPVEVRHLVHAVDRLRDDWAEADEDHRHNLWTNVHAANERVWNRLKPPPTVSRPDKPDPYGQIYDRM
jgi:hypothetical protein